MKLLSGICPIVSSNRSIKHIIGSILRLRHRCLENHNRKYANPLNLSAAVKAVSRRVCVCCRRCLETTIGNKLMKLLPDISPIVQDTAPGRLHLPPSMPSDRNRVFPVMKLLPDLFPIVQNGACLSRLPLSIASPV